LAWIEAIKARNGPQTDEKSPQEARTAIRGAFSRTDISIYEVLAGLARRSSNYDAAVWQRIRELHAQRFGAGSADPPRS
jgi:hypothetical protein